MTKCRGVCYWSWVLFAATGCGEAKPDRVDTLIELSCGPLQVRFQERTKTINSMAGVYDFTEFLQIDSGSGFRLVDSAGRTGSSGHRGGPEAFSRLLPKELAFRAYPFDDSTRPETPGRSRWGLFVDPKAATREEYDIVAACIGQNLTAIDAAFDAPRATGGTPGDSDQRRQISSIVYAAYHDEMNMCGRETVGARWECPGGGYVKTRLETPELILCAAQQKRSTPFVTFLPVGMAVGALAPDQKTLKLWKPDPSSHDYRTLLEGKDERAYYASCRDRAGRGLFETLTAAGPP